MNEIDFFDLSAVLLLTFTLFLIIFIRFLIVSGAYHYTFFYFVPQKI